MRLLAVLVCLLPMAVRADEGPTLVTKRYLRALLASDAALLHAIDPARGIVRIEFTESLRDDQGERARAVRLCKTSVAAEVTKLRALYARRVEDQAEQLACENKPAPRCSLAGSHDEPTVYLVFEVVPGRGLVLVGVRYLQEATMGNAWLRRKNAFVRREEARLSATRCPP